MTTEIAENPIPTAVTITATTDYVVALPKLPLLFGVKTLFHKPYNWYYIKGGGRDLVSFYYVKVHDGEKYTRKDLKKLEKGKDYFDNENDAMDYAISLYGIEQETEESSENSNDSIVCTTASTTATVTPAAVTGMVRMFEGSDEDDESYEEDSDEDEYKPNQAKDTLLKNGQLMFKCIRSSYTKKRKKKRQKIV
jgi:hypothetical protein